MSSLALERGMASMCMSFSSKLKSYFSFKKRYGMSNLGLVGYNKRFLYCAFGAPLEAHMMLGCSEAQQFMKIF